MVLRPILPADPLTAPEAVGAWIAVEHSQRAAATAWWIIPQPAHSALAGEIAARLRPQLFALPEGALDNTVTRAIALHDSGWGQLDAQQIERLRAGGARERPVSFLDMAGPEAIKAWASSADIAERAAPVSGYMVSRHFWRIAGRTHESGGSPQEFDRFRDAEVQRQQRLLKRCDLPVEHLERLTDALQFADLLSLLVSSGTTRSATLTSSEGPIQVSSIENAYRAEPSPFALPETFAFSALRHPLVKGELSGQTFSARFL
jgi:hypothetical protein